MGRFEDLPYDLRCGIVKKLDPITFLRMSMTSSKLYTLLKPKPSHHLEALLALELVPEYGGIVPRFRARDNRVSPPFESEEWRTNKYACSGCLDLLPHYMFDHRSILGLEYRKPPPGSREAKTATSWQPSDRLLQSAALAKREGQRGWRKRYHLAVTGRHLRYRRQFGNRLQPPRHDDALAAEAEKVLCGILRYKRLCLECKRQAGRLPEALNRGTPENPLIHVRTVEYPDSFDRLYPGFLAPLPLEEWPTQRSVNRVESGGNKPKLTPFPLLMAPCPVCGTWKEFADFRHSDISLDIHDVQSSWRQWSSQGAILCHHCLRRRIGTDRFRRRIVKQAVKHLLTRIPGVIWDMTWGWLVLHGWFYGLGVTRRNGRVEVIRPWDKPFDNDDVEDFNDLRRRHDIFKRFVYEELQVNHPEVFERATREKWVKNWIDDFGKLVSIYFDYKGAICEMVNNPGRLEKAVLDPKAIESIFSPSVEYAAFPLDQL
ncbi:hypothetical protein B0T24DRAFT_585168 [Lasiosphaeria ovina]|uniref:F-box domain-containing protein n=1 Tax=Lasiosphaeria ovina TaxID=92902 RepID=A0AAE0JTL2_9PEZI|nr:hypothetical protein B0T24DRAFT_585168 [Lasiosphaeria ovina]